MLAAHLEILERKGNRWCVGTTACGVTEEALLEDADKATGYYSTPEYLQYTPDAQVHVAAITEYCAECNGSGQVRSTRAPGHKRCPACKGRRSTVYLYRHDVRITWPTYQAKGA